MWHRIQWGRAAKTSVAVCSAQRGQSLLSASMPRAHWRQHSFQLPYKSSRWPETPGFVAQWAGAATWRRAGAAGSGEECFYACVPLTYPLSPLIAEIQPRRPLPYHLTPVCLQHSRVSSVFCPLPTPPHSSSGLSSQQLCSGVAVAVLIHQAGSALLSRHAHRPWASFCIPPQTQTIP